LDIPTPSRPALASGPTVASEDLAQASRFLSDAVAVFDRSRAPLIAGELRVKSLICTLRRELEDQARAGRSAAPFSVEPPLVAPRDLPQPPAAGGAR